MLKISKLADYATIIMGLLAEPANESLSATQVAEKARIPLPTVSKILKLLNEAELVVSMRGPQGGYKLAAQPATISIGRIIAAIDGHPALTECSQKGSCCALEASCQLRGNWRKINKRIWQMLNGIMLAEMNGSLNL